MAWTWIQLEDYIHVLKNNSVNSSWKAPIWRVFSHFQRSKASCFFLSLCHTQVPLCVIPPTWQHPRCLSKLQNTNITSFLFLFSVEHVSALHCAIKRRQFLRFRGRAECSQLAEYTNLFGAESEGTPTNRFLRTGHSLQGAGRSPASIGSSVQKAKAFSSAVHPYGAHTHKRHWSNPQNFTAKSLPREFLVAEQLSVKRGPGDTVRAALHFKETMLIKTQDSKCKYFHHSS